MIQTKIVFDTIAQSNYNLAIAFFHELANFESRWLQENPCKTDEEDLLFAFFDSLLGEERVTAIVKENNDYNVPNSTWVRFGEGYYAVKTNTPAPEELTDTHNAQLEKLLAWVAPKEKRDDPYFIEKVISEIFRPADTCDFEIDYATLRERIKVKLVHEEINGNYEERFNVVYFDDEPFVIATEGLKYGAIVSLYSWNRSRFEYIRSIIMNQPMSYDLISTLTNDFLTAKEWWGDRFGNQVIQDYSNNLNCAKQPIE